MVIIQKIDFKKIVASQGVRVGTLAVLLKIMIIQTMLGWDKFLKVPGYGLFNFLIFLMLGVLVGFYLPGPLGYIKSFLIGFTATLVYNLSAAKILHAVVAIPMAYEIMYGIETGILAIAAYYILYGRKR